MLRGIARRGDLVQGTDTLWYELIQQATSAQGFQLRFMARGLSRGSPCGKHLLPLLASPEANTKHLVVCFLLTHKTAFSMLTVEKCAKLHFSAVIDAFLATMDNGQGIGNPQNAMGSPT